MQINSIGATGVGGTASIPIADLKNRFSTNILDTNPDGSLLLKNGINLSDSGISTKDTLQYVTNNWANFNTILTYTSSGSFTVPAGVTKIGVWVVGGGGGGARYYISYTGTSDVRTQTSETGANGGYGGAGYKNFNVNGGDIFTFTIGAGGKDAVAGGTTTFTYNGISIVSTGGGAGNGGVTGTNGSCSNYDYIPTGYSGYSFGKLLLNYKLEKSFSFNYASRDAQYLYRTDTYAAAIYTDAGSYKMGAAGVGGVPTDYGRGGVSGGVFILYESP